MYRHIHMNMISNDYRLIICVNIYESVRKISCVNSLYKQDFCFISYGMQ